MASIRKRGDRWQAQVRRLGHPPLTRTFVNKRDAEAWARQRESDLDHQQFATPSLNLRRLKFGELLDRYLLEVTPRKRGHAVEANRVKCLRRNSLSDLSLADLSPRVLAQFRDARLAQVASSTVRREFVIIRHVLEVARREWEVPMRRNPAREIALPSPPPGRNRRLTVEEHKRLELGLAGSRNPLLRHIVSFAIATGLRRGELLAMCWREVDVERRLLSVPQTKTGVSRVVPLTDTALGTLHSVARTQPDDRVFPLSPNALRIAWRRLTKRANILDLNFHDLRHEAISRFFEMGLSLPEVALISGHKDPRMLLRYTHLRPSHVVERLIRLAAAASPVVTESKLQDT